MKPEKPVDHSRLVLLRRLWKWRWRPPVFPAMVLIVFVLLALLPGVFAPHDPLATDLQLRFRPPAWLNGGDGSNLLGTDALGRDVLSRIVHGARVSLGVAVAALVLAGFVGLVIGVISGYTKGWLDVVLMRLADAAMSIPLFLIALMLAVVRGPSALNVILVIGGLTWAQYARVMRGEVLSFRQR